MATRGAVPHLTHARDTTFVLWFPHPTTPTTHPTSRDILERCVRGLTQNANGSFHSKIWSCVQKAKFAGFKRLSFVAESAILDHNLGYQKASLMKSFKVNSKALRKFFSQQDKERRRHSKGKLQPKAKKKEQKTGDYVPGISVVSACRICAVFINNHLLLSTIIKSSEKVLKLVGSSALTMSVQATRSHDPIMEKMECLLQAWLEGQNQARAAVSKALIKEKALAL
ncbi:hypothetical protein GWK47_032711 [Chionoecetes opilio]|uniref:Uncharacterized protein n=1 Tax=Chionoecetes opilio TaxID=41210 RepID=A0A8J5D3P1_CHIOP|nr:hypothetical protein GWK47_032711 [Chionoecetes opilio]